jgi:hypothetical protein
MCTGPMYCAVLYCTLTSKGSNGFSNMIIGQAFGMLASHLSNVILGSTTSVCPEEKCTVVTSSA